MLELSADNVLHYLRSNGRLGDQSARVEVLGGGVSNLVLRVTTPEQIFVLKQSRPQLRTKAAWFSDLDRVYREQEVMQALHPVLPAGVVPAILFVDRPNYVFAMEHAPADAVVWKARLLEGDIDLALGERAGAILAHVHAAPLSDAARFSDSTVFVQLRVDPFYRRIAQRHPDLAQVIQPLIHGMLGPSEILCHGDFSPKNLLVHANGFMLVDYETAYLGEPAMDLGFFLSHLLLKAIKRPTDHIQFFELTRRFWKSYGFFPERMIRGIGHLGVCLLARVDGTSLVDYLTEEPQREAVRRLGRFVLRDKPDTWEDVLARASQEIAQLRETMSNAEKS